MQLSFELLNSKTALHQQNKKKKTAYTFVTLSNTNVSVLLGSRLWAC